MKKVFYIFIVSSFMVLQADFRSNKLLEDYWCSIGHFNFDQGELFATLARALKPQYVLETGFCTGHSALSILLSCDPIKFLSVDIDLDYRKPDGRIYAQKLQDKFNAFNIIEADSKALFSKDFFRQAFPEGLDWVTVDGDHSYKGCTFDLNTTAKYLNQNGIIVIDDYKAHRPNGMRLRAVDNAVNDFLKKNPIFKKVEWNVQGKGIALLTKSSSVIKLIRQIIPSHMLK